MALLTKPWKADSNCLGTAAQAAFCRKRPKLWENEEKAPDGAFSPSRYLVLMSEDQTFWIESTTLSGIGT